MAGCACDRSRQGYTSARTALEAFSGRRGDGVPGMNLREYRQALGQELQGIRRRMNIGFLDLCRRLNLSPAQVSRILNGEVWLRAYVLARFGLIFGLRPSTILAMAEAQLGLGPRPKADPPPRAPVSALDYCRRIGEAVRRFRKTLRLSEAAFARRMGMSQGQVSRLERGEQGLRFRTLCRLAEALGLRPAELLEAAEPRVR